MVANTDKWYSSFITETDPGYFYIQILYYQYYIIVVCVCMRVHTCLLSTGVYKLVSKPSKIVATYY